MDKIPVIIDCDPGHDDAIALMLAFGCQRLNVLGVTTVAGNSTGINTYQNALRVLSLIGTKVEVVRGADRPLLRPLTLAQDVHGEKGLYGLSNVKPDFRESKRSAHRFLLDTILDYPDKVTLIPTGPLTNIAIALLAEPRLKDKIERIVFMGGAAKGGNITPEAEFNIFVDPESAKIVIDSGISLTMIGLDVTHKALIYADEVERIKDIGRMGRVVGDILDSYSTFYLTHGFSGIPIHDALAVAAVFAPGIVKGKYASVDIEIHDELTLGKTMVDFETSKTPNCHVALDVDRERFISILTEAIKNIETSVY
jgi:pyrimidine-specific ribonucleoside hydrolase